VRITSVLLVLCCMLYAPANSQYLESTIVLPDTLGPLNGPYHIACTGDSAFPRLYIGGEGDSGGVIVAEAITCKRLARVSTGPVKTLCFVPPHGKLYVARAGSDSIVVVDCATNQISSVIHTADSVPVMQYDGQNDRLYCGGNATTVIDCAADTVVHTIAVSASAFALDSSDAKLYAGGGGPLTVIDCATDSVTAIIREIGPVEALSFNPTAGKVYATSGETLYAVRTDGDSIVTRLHFTSLLPVLACDPQRNRVFFAYGHDTQYLGSLDCSCDSALLKQPVFQTAYSLVCNVARDRLYHVGPGRVIVADGTTGQTLTWVLTQSLAGSVWTPRLDRLYCPPAPSDPPYSQQQLLTAVVGTGDSIAGIVPLTMCAGQVTVDTVHNRLYFVYQTVSVGCVGAVDCSRNIVTWYRYAGNWTSAICYNPNNDHLYWATSDEDSASSFVKVFDCATESVIKRIPIGGEIFNLKLHEGLNKLCVYSDGCDVSIIDCKYDTLVTRIPLAPNAPRPILLVPEDNRFWYLGVYDVVVVDLVGDTVVARAADTLTSLDDACACSEDRKIYTSNGQVIEADNPRHVDSIPFFANRFCYVPGLHKLYGVSNYMVPPPPPGNSVFRVLDTRSDSVTATFNGPRQVSGMCLDHTGNYIYCAVYADSVMFVIDVRGDSVVSTFPVPTWAAARDPLVANRTTNRIYEASYDFHFGGIPVVRDSMLIGLEELVTMESRPGASPTLVSRSAPFRASISAELYDATGRKAATLRQGLNDISQLAPGVYFVRQAQAQAQAQAIRKVVVQR